MPLNVRPIATGVAVISFFTLSFIGWLSDLSPFTCCKRALTGAVLAYIATALAVKAINAILMHAVISKQINKQKERSSGGTD
ncbi:MAG: hypothetical protein AMJ43_07530 [Coxiella sp. DG_40]|nr:MAG: hypothetical protein AMJ43_07530 [Coxiella sp. DG_40]